MSTALEILTRLKRVDVYQASQTAIENTSSTMINVQRDQLFQGVRKDSDSIVPSYAARTIKYKQKKGQPYDRVTLKDTGSFYAGIKVDVTGDKFILSSTDSKAAALEKKYSPLIFGLNNQSRIDYIRSLKPELIRVIKRQMNGSS